MTKTDKLFVTALGIAILFAIYAFFGVVALYIIATVIASVAIVGFLAWLNHLTGGYVAFVLVLIGLN